jgi:hypothetical protein
VLLIEVVVETQSCRHKSQVETVLILCPKFTKTHLRASLVQKNFFRLADARHKGRGGKGEGVDRIVEEHEISVSDYVGDLHVFLDEHEDVVLFTLVDAVNRHR